jgi:hypothetical protein
VTPEETQGAAWLPDPKGSGMLRWYDGSSWSDHLSSFPPPPGPPGVEQESRTDFGWILTPGFNRRALLAGYLGFASLFLVPGPFSTVAGLWALADLRRRPNQKGWGRAWFAVWAGLAGTLGMLVFSLTVLR